MTQLTLQQWNELGDPALQTVNWIEGSRIDQYSRAGFPGFETCAA